MTSALKAAGCGKQFKDYFSNFLRGCLPEKKQVKY
jgi:hypothetical protein